ncbi:30S ribosomal protein S5 [Candidatus Bipolaricaulota bacterium]|nr:30S ribosomal protein S5 [Candidatus Bipolaricaulota bacterium]
MNTRRRSTDEFENEIIDIRRVSKVTKGGRNLKFRVTIVVGDRKGRVGVGLGNTTEIPRAIQQAVRDAKKHMVTVNLDDGTLPHEVIGKFKAGNVLLKPAHPGTGIIAGVTVGAICRLAGIKNVLTKSLGTNNPLTLSRATIDGLVRLRSREEIATLRGIATLEEVKNEA